MSKYYYGPPTRKEIFKYVLSVNESQQIKEKKAKEIKVNPDSEIRKLIHNIIVDGLNQGKSNQQIIEELKKKYPNSNLSRYYNGYIENERRKIEKSKDDDGER